MAKIKKIDLEANIPEVLPTPGPGQFIKEGFVNQAAIDKRKAKDDAILAADAEVIEPVVIEPIEPEDPSTISEVVDQIQNEQSDLDKAIEQELGLTPEQIEAKAGVAGQAGTLLAAQEKAALLLKVQQGGATAQEEFQLKKLQEQGAGAIAGTTASLAQSREGAVGTSAPSVIKQFETATLERIQQADNAIATAKAQRKILSEQLADAQENQKFALAADIQKQMKQLDIEVANAETKQFNALQALSSTENTKTTTLLDTFETMGSAIADLSVSQLSSMIEGSSLTLSGVLAVQKAVQLQAEAVETKNEDERIIKLLEAEKLLAENAQIGVTKPTAAIQNFEYFQTLKKQGYSDDQLLEFQRLSGTAPDQLSEKDRADIAKIYADINESAGVEGGGAAVATSILAASSAQGFKGGHKALDYTLPGQENAIVKTPVTGTVIDFKNDGAWNGGWGNYVLIDTGEGTHRFAHLSSVDPSVTMNGIISSGQPMGNQGKTGNVTAVGATGTGVHVHYEITDTEGNKVDPREFLKGVRDARGGAEQIAQDIFAGVSTLKISDLPQKQKAEVAKELNILKQQAIDSDDAFGFIRASAGGKDVDATAIQRFEKTATVIDQLGLLVNKLDERKVKGEDAGGDTIDLAPLTGFLRSKNPWDQNAQEIKAILQGTIPNLARGVFGEVGVLTDRDIELYRKTLPNLTQPEDIQKSIAGITLRTLQRSLERGLKSQAGFGRDVSGILPLYQDLVNGISSLEAELGIIDPELASEQVVIDPVDSDIKALTDIKTQLQFSPSDQVAELQELLEGQLFDNQS